MKHIDIIRIANEELNNARALVAQRQANAQTFTESESMTVATTRLSRAYFEISNRLTTTAGKATVGGPNLGRIKLSGKIFADPRNSEADLRNTIRHEVAHIAVPQGSGHGPVWQRMAKLLGCTAERCHEMAVQAKTRYNFEVSCSSCGHVLGVIRNRTTSARYLNGKVTTCCRAKCISKKV